MVPPERSSLGTWLLEHAGVDDALVGDLAEGSLRLHSEQGERSGLWYWRQVIAAIAQSWAQTIVHHKWLAMRAIVTGWVLWATLFLVMNALNSSTPQAWIPMASGLIKYGQWLAIGWTIGVLHRPYYASMVLPYVLFTMVMSVPAVSQMVVTLFGHPRYNAPSATIVILAVVSLLMGGLLSAETRHKVPRVRRHTPSHSPIG
jgi:hypothetical protein